VPILLCQGEGHIERTVIGKVRTTMLLKHQRSRSRKVARKD